MGRSVCVCGWMDGSAGGPLVREIASAWGRGEDVRRRGRRGGGSGSVKEKRAYNLWERLKTLVVFSVGGATAVLSTGGAMYTCKIRHNLHCHSVEENARYSDKKYAELGYEIVRTLKGPNNERPELDLKDNGLQAKFRRQRNRTDCGVYLICGFRHMDSNGYTNNWEAFERRIDGV